MTPEHIAPGGAAAEHAEQTAQSAGGDEERGGVSDDWRDHGEEHVADSVGAGLGGLAGRDWGDGDSSHAALQSAWMDYENKLQTENGGTAGDAVNGDESWAERVKRSAWASDGGPEETSTLAADGNIANIGNPETAIRQVLKNALDQPEETRPAERGTADPFQDFWQGFSSGEDEQSVDLDDHRASAIAEQIENVRRSSVLYDASALRDGYTGDDESSSDPEIHDGIAAAFKHETASKRPPVRPEYRHDTSLTDYDAGADEGADGDFGADYLNGDAVALQAELENFGHMPYEEQRRGGGLALVAAWAVFLSVVSGVALAFVNFRDNIMTVLPGTTRLYSTIGFDIADRKVEFGNVGYRWSTSGDKPVLEIKGQVINMTDREVDVPRVLITLHDGKNSDGIKTVETVTPERLTARETAPFKWEITASKAVNQVELEFDNTRQQ